MCRECVPEWRPWAEWLLTRLPRRVRTALHMRWKFHRRLRHPIWWGIAARWVWRPHPALRRDIAEWAWECSAELWTDALRADGVARKRVLSVAARVEEQFFAHMDKVYGQSDE